MKDYIITVKLTEDQAQSLLNTVEEKIERAKLNSQAMEMGLDPKWLAFQKRLLTKLAQAIVDGKSQELVKL